MLPAPLSESSQSPEQKEKDRNVRKFGVSHNVAGHGKLRRALHRSDRGDKKIKGDKSAYVEMESVVKEGKKKGLWDNIHAKRKRGEKPAKPGDKDYPKTLNIEHHEKDKDGNTIPHENLNELNRYGKETGKATGSMNKRPGSPVKKGGSGDKALNVVRGMIRKQQGKPEGQQKKVKGIKSDAGTGKYLDKQTSKKAFADRAKKAGYKNPQDYANVVARYGSEDNMKRGRGLGT